MSMRTQVPEIYSSPVDKEDCMEAANTIYLARQPIFDSRLQVVAYELLFRNSATNAAFFHDGNEATSRLIINTFVEVGLDTITSGRKAFINLTHDFITGVLPLPFGPENVVLEILEDVSVDDEVLAGIRRLAEEGYELALDDFVLTEHNQALVPLASIIKVDIQLQDEAGLRIQVAHLHNSQARLLAEKVESHAEFALCRELGFTLFQGYFFCEPVMISSKQVMANQLALLEILARLQAPDCDLKALEDIISRDVGISYKLLKIINSSYFNLRRKVHSLQHALVILGLKTLTNWITVISLSMVSGKPDELITTALMRAKMCETLAAGFGCRDDTAFIVGLFSLLDALLDQPKAALLANLSLADDIVDALLHRTGTLGELLSIVEEYERGVWACTWQSAPFVAEANTAYLRAAQWTRSVAMQLH